MNATIFEAKTRLSELLKRAQEGEEVIITSGRDKTPIARLERIAAPKPQRLGALQDETFSLAEGFWDPLPEEELRAWEDEPVTLLPTASKRVTVSIRAYARSHGRT